MKISQLGIELAKKQCIDRAISDQTLLQNLTQLGEQINELVLISLNQHQFDALLSFVFSIKINKFKDSEILHRLNNKENPIDVIKEELPKWNKDNKGKVLSGLIRQRTIEIEVFSAVAPGPKTGIIDIRSKQRTWLKKSPVNADKLSNAEKAQVVRDRILKGCQIIDQKNNHTQLEFDFNFGKWWVLDEHWEGLNTTINIKPYFQQGELRYLRNFPYYYQQDDAPAAWRRCQTQSIAMCLRYLDIPGIETNLDYFKIVEKHGNITYQSSHKAALKELNVFVSFMLSVDEFDIKEQIDNGMPVVAGVYQRGPLSDLESRGHYVVISGYDKTHWLVQDPYGELDLINGGWKSTGANIGNNIRYSFEEFNPRCFYGGGANGWCWLNFKKN
jgi:GH24 family phage-related lysozyme (muramidase)